MRKILLAVVLALGVAGCVNGQLVTSIPNPVTNSNLYEGELVFEASLKTFNKLKELCANRVLPPACRTYVIKAQAVIPKIAKADLAARDFITNNPTINPATIISVFTGLVSGFKANVDSLSATQIQ